MKLFLSLLLCLSCQMTSLFAQKHDFQLGDSSFLLDGKPFQMISGEMHCTRIPREYWRDRIRKAKAMGLNTIGTYIFWNVHEPQPGKYVFSGNEDIAEFVRIAQQEGMWVVMRPSPYVCAEWEFGGYPYWLLQDSTMKVRSRDPKFLAAYRRYINRLAKELVPLQVTHGGNILMIQIENEYGSYSNDVAYLDTNRVIFQQAGLDVPLFTCDPVWALPNGVLPGYLPTVNGSSDPAEVKSIVNKFHNGKGPYYVAEWYPGWFDDWGAAHHTTNADKDAQNLEKLLAAGISVNMYMFHGGTTRGFMNGANMNDRDPYSPQVSSYDYDAPLNESGNPTPKYYKFRNVIEKYISKDVVLPALPTINKAQSIGSIAFTQSVSLSQILSSVPHKKSDKTLSFEDLHQAYGFVWYRTTLSQAKGWLKLEKMRDFATVYLNGKRVAVLDRRLKQDSVLLNGSANAVLDILVENNGRINFGKYLIDNRQGLVGNVTLNGEKVLGWMQYQFPFESVSDLKFKKGITSSGPALYKGTFRVKQLTDTYLDMSGFGKGFVFLNGHNLGKYWQIGPQQTIYVPACWLKKGKNEIEVLDQLKAGHKTIATIDHSILNQTK